MSEATEVLTFACPHCGGPLHVEDGGAIVCEVRHRFSLGEVLVEQARSSSQATWQAVRALQQRAATARWAANDPDLNGLSDPTQLHESAASDEETAATLQRQAQALDLTIWRLTVPGAPELLQENDHAPN